MKIAFVGGRGVPALYSGFETMATEVGARLVERGHDVTAYCRTGYGDQTELVHRGIKKKFLPRINFKFIDTLSHTFFSFVHLFFNPVDVIIMVNCANGPLCIIPRLRGIPFAINVDGFDWRRAKWPSYGKLYIYFAAWCCTKLAPAVVTDSENMKQYYLEQWNCRSHFIAYGAEVTESKSPEILDEYGLVPEEYFIVIARLEPENNTDLIIDAFMEVETDKKLVIVGNVSFNSTYLQAYRDDDANDRVMFLGGIYEKERLSEILCNSFAYVHGHMAGGTSPTLLWALGSGTCILYADLDCNAEVVGEAGIAFPLSVEGARASFRALLDDPDESSRRRLIGPERVREHYTWDIITDQYEALCEEIVSGGGAGDAM